MILKSPDPTRRIVEDYDFTFNGGQVLRITTDKEGGDTVSFEQAPLAIQIKITEKPSLAPGFTNPAREVTIFQTHLIAIEKSLREVVDMTVEQKEQWKEAIKVLTTPPPSIN